MDALIEMAVGLALGFMLEGTTLFVPESAQDPRTNAYESVEWRDALRRVLVELETLPEREQAIIRHHYLTGLEFDRIAALLGISKGRASQLHRAALALLRKRLLNASDFKLRR
jgi:RNA polymerase sigma factor for flagellar operon FliA